jgi:hypothetical protein
MMSSSEFVSSHCQRAVAIEVPVIPDRENRRAISLQRQSFHSKEMPGFPESELRAASMV